MSEDRVVETNENDAPTRRDVLKASLGVGGALFVVFGIPQIARGMKSAVPAKEVPVQAEVAPFVPNAVVKIERSGEITLTMSQAEMGQGAYSSMSMLIAEELEA